MKQTNETPAIEEQQKPVIIIEVGDSPDPLFTLNKIIKERDSSLSTKPSATGLDDIAKSSQPIAHPTVKDQLCKQPKSSLEHRSSDVGTSQDPVCYNGKFAENRRKGNMSFSRSPSASSTKTNKSTTGSEDQSGVIRSRSSSSTGTCKKLTDRFTKSSMSKSTNSTPSQQHRVVRSNLKRPCSSSSTDKNSHHDPPPSKEAKISKRKSKFKVIDYSSATRKNEENKDTQNSLPTRNNKDDSLRGTASSQVDSAPSTSATKFQFCSRDFSNPSQVQKCSTCKAYFLDVNELVDHACYPSACALCALKFMTKNELNEHNEKVHNRIKNNRSPTRNSTPAPCNTSPQTPTQDKSSDIMELQCFLPERKSKGISKKMTRVIKPSKAAQNSPTRYTTLGKLMKTLKRFEPKGTFGLAIGEVSRFRCVRCSHFFINCNQFCTHYKNCKLPFDRNALISDRSVQWLCLRCQSSFSSRSEVQEHGKVTCINNNVLRPPSFRKSASSTISDKALNNKTKPATSTMDMPALDIATPSNEQSTISAISVKANAGQTRVRRTSVNQEMAVNAEAMNAQENEKVDYCPSCEFYHSVSDDDCRQRMVHIKSCIVKLPRTPKNIVEKRQVVKEAWERANRQKHNKVHYDSIKDQHKLVLSDEAIKHSSISRVTPEHYLKVCNGPFDSRFKYPCCTQFFSEYECFLVHAQVKHNFELTKSSKKTGFVQCGLCGRLFYDDGFFPVHSPCTARCSHGKLLKTGKTNNFIEQDDQTTAGPHIVSQLQLPASSTTSQPNVGPTASNIDHQNGVNKTASAAGCAPLSSATLGPSLPHENSSEHCSTSKNNSGTLSESLPDVDSVTTCNNSNEAPAPSKETLCQLDLKHILPDLLEGSSSKLFMPRNHIEKQLRAAGVNPKPSIIKQFIEAPVQDTSTKDAVDVPPETPENMADLPPETSEDTLDTLSETPENPEQTQECNLSSEEKLEFGNFEFPDAWYVKDTGNIDSEVGKPAERYVCANCYLSCVDKCALSSHFIATHDLSMDGRVKVKVFNNPM